MNVYCLILLNIIKASKKTLTVLTGDDVWVGVCVTGGADRVACGQQLVSLDSARLDDDAAAVVAGWRRLAHDRGALARRLLVPLVQGHQHGEHDHQQQDGGHHQRRQHWVHRPHT